MMEVHALAIAIKTAPPEARAEAMTLLAREKPIEYITPFLRLRETGDAAALNENPTYKVKLIDHGTKKIEVIKILKDRLGIGLAEAKDLAESAPVVVAEFASETDAWPLRRFPARSPFRKGTGTGRGRGNGAVLAVAGARKKRGRAPSRLKTESSFAYVRGRTDPLPPYT